MKILAIRRIYDKKNIWGIGMCRSQDFAEAEALLICYN